MAKEQFEFSNFNDLSENAQGAINQFIKETEEELQEDWLRTAFDHMNTSLSKKHLRYGTVLKINMDKVTDPFSTYMLPIFIKPGRTHFILRTPEDKLVKSRVEKNARVRMMNYHKPEDVCFKFYYNRHIVPMREEKVPGCKYLLHG